MSAMRGLTKPLQGKQTHQETGGALNSLLLLGLGEGVRGR